MTAHLSELLEYVLGDGLGVACLRAVANEDGRRGFRRRCGSRGGGGKLLRGRTGRACRNRRGGVDVRGSLAITFASVMKSDERGEGNCAKQSERRRRQDRRAAICHDDIFCAIFESGKIRFQDTKPSRYFYSSKRRKKKGEEEYKKVNPRCPSTSPDWLSDQRHSPSCSCSY